MRRSRNSYILSPRRVTRTPMATPLRSLKFEISLVEYVGTAFCPVMVDISFTADSIIFLSDTASPIPWLMHIFFSLGTCMDEVYWNCFCSAGITSVLYLPFKRG